MPNELSLRPSKELANTAFIRASNDLPEQAPALSGACALLSSAGAAPERRASRLRAKVSRDPRHQILDDAGAAELRQRTDQQAAGSSSSTRVAPASGRCQSIFDLARRARSAKPIVAGAHDHVHASRASSRTYARLPGKIRGDRAELDRHFAFEIVAGGRRRETRTRQARARHAQYRAKNAQTVSGGCETREGLPDLDVRLAAGKPKR